MPSNFLLLSATITPPAGMPALARTNPAERLADYARALRFYLTLAGSCFDGIVFAENSQSDLTTLRDLVGQEGLQDRVELLSFNGIDHPPSYGRGYGEFKLVDHAMEHSRILSNLGEGYVWKCTGRYILRNLPKLVATRPACDLYCHMRNYPYRLCELYAMSWNRPGYERAVRGVYQRLRNDVVPGRHTIEESAFRTFVDSLPKEVRVVPRFRHVPIIEGIRGWNNSLYSDRAWDKKIVIRRTANRLAPWLWI